VKFVFKKLVVKNFNVIKNFVIPAIFWREASLPVYELKTRIMDPRLKHSGMTGIFRYAVTAAFIFLIIGVNSSYAAKKIMSYSDLVQQNLQLRQQLQQVKQEFSTLENDRNVLILRLRDLQRGVGKKELEKRISELEQQLEKINKDAQVNEEKLKSVEEEFKKKFHDKDLQIKSLLEGREEGVKERERLKEKIIQKEEAIIQEEKKTKEEAQKRILLESKLKFLEDEQKEMVKASQMVERQKKELEEKIELIEEEKLKEIADMKQTVEIQIRDLENKIKDSENILVSMRGDFQERESKLVIEKKSLKNNFERIMNEVKMYRAKVRELDQALMVSLEREKDLEEELQARFSVQMKQEEQIEELQIDKFSVEAKLAKQGEKLDKTARKIADKVISQVKQKSDKERVDMHYNMAVVYDQNGRYEDSEREYLKCLRINPEDADVHYNIAILYDDKLNRNEEAIRHYKKYLELRPKGRDIVQVKHWMILAEQEARLGAEMR